MRNIRVDSWTALLLGLVLTVTATLVTFLWPESVPVTLALVVALVGVAITFALELRVKVSELEGGINQLIHTRRNHDQVIEWSRIDRSILDRYNELRQELEDISKGQYFMRPYSDLYFDNIEYMKTLQDGERFFASCPVSTVSIEMAVRQLSDPHYRASMRAHRAAAENGVHITRLYIFKNRAYAQHSEIKTHLLELAQTENLNIRLVFRDNATLDGALDFLIFGNRKVSAGKVDPETGIVSEGIIYLQPDEIKNYKHRFEILLMQSVSFWDEFP